MKFIVFLLLAFIAFLLGAYLVIDEKPYVRTIENSPTPTQNPDLLNADKLFQLVNIWRTRNGYQPYKKSEFACSVADKRLPEVIKNWSHDGFIYSKYCDNCYLGENLVRGYKTNQESLDAWLKSSTHRSNLSSNYTHSCIKCSTGHCVQTFSYY